MGVRRWTGGASGNPVAVYVWGHTYVVEVQEGIGKVAEALNGIGHSPDAGLAIWSGY